MRKIVVRFGLFAGGAVSLLMVVTMGIAKLAGSMPSGGIGMAIGYATMVLSFVFVYFGVRSYRDTVKGGRVRFWPAFGVGLLISLIAMACYSATWQVVYPVMLPDYAETYAAEAVKQVEAKGASPAEVEKTRQEMAKFVIQYKNPFYNFAVTLLEPSPIALLVSLISAGVLSRRRREPLSTLGSAVS